MSQSRCYCFFFPRPVKRLAFFPIGFADAERILTSVWFKVKIATNGANGLFITYTFINRDITLNKNFFRKSFNLVLYTISQPKSARRQQNKDPTYTQDRNRPGE